MTAASDLEQEYQYFKENLPELIDDHAYEYVVIKDQEVQDYFDSFSDAWKWASEKFEANTYIIQQVQEGHSNVILSAVPADGEE